MKEKINFSVELTDEVIKERLNLAVHWILNSGVQNVFQENSHTDGGFGCWYDMEKKEYPFVYAEITAYAIKALLYLYDREKQSKYLERAEKAADWLITHMQCRSKDTKAKGGFFWKRLLDGSLSPFVYSFDTGMCITALTDLFRATKKYRYLDSATTAAEWLVKVMQNESGSSKACYDFQNRSFGDGKWSRAPGSYHAKISIGLLKLYNLTQDARLTTSVNSLCNWVLKLQEQNGKINTNENSGDTYLHAHCYAIEGLLYAFKESNYAKLEKAAFEGAKWLINAQNSKGGMSRWYYDDYGFSYDENTEALAQAIRIWLILDTLSHQGNIFYGKIEKALERLLSLQYLATEDSRAKGGFYYAIIDHKLVPHINCCATLFSIQAFQMYLDWKAQRLSFDHSLNWLI